MFTPTTIIHPLSRWRPRRRKAVHAARWQAWSERLRQRYGRGATPRFGIGMVYARLARTAQPVTQTTVHTTVQSGGILQPRIDMSFHARLIAPVGPPMVLWRTGAAPRSAVEGPGGRAVPRFGPADGGSPMRQAVARAGAGGGGTLARPSATGPRAGGHEIQSPVTLRQASADARLGDRRPDLPASSQDRVRGEDPPLVRRVIEARRRVEVGRWRTDAAPRTADVLRGSIETQLSLMLAPRPSGAIAPDLAMVHAQRSAARTARTEAPDAVARVERREPVPSAPAPAAVDVQQLTDDVMRQIDRRLVAYRERLGKAF